MPMLAASASPRAAATCLHRRWRTTLVTPGGAPRDVLENVITADWSPDEAEIAVVRAIDGGRVQVEFPIGTKIYESSSHVGSIRVSPRGDRVAFIEGQGEGGARIVVVDRGGRTTVLARAV